MIKILSGEFKKYWSEIRTYYPDHVVSMIITFIIFSVFTILMIMILKIKIGFHLVLIPIFFITVIGILGFTLILVSLTLKYTKTASFESIISYALLFLTGAIIPYDLLPGVIQRVGNYIPIALGIRISRELINNKRVSLIELGALVGQSFIYFIVGYLIFKYIYRKSRINGLDHSY